MSDSQKNIEDILNGKTFHICKAQNTSPMNAVMVRRRKDIPNHLKGSVFFIEAPEDLPENIKSNLRFTENGEAERMDMRTGEWAKVRLPQILTQAVENKGILMACDSGMLIKYEKTGQLSSGYGTWPKTNWATTTYRNTQGKWHNKPQVLQAALIHDGIPAFALGGNIQQTPDGGYIVHTSWGSVSEGKAGNGYLVRYGDNEDGSPKLNILTRTEESVDSYMVCTENGHQIFSLRLLDNIIQQMRGKEENNGPDKQPGKYASHAKGRGAVNGSNRIDTSPKNLSPAKNIPEKVRTLQHNVIKLRVI